MNYHFKIVKIHKVCDGDTIKATIDLGCETLKKDCYIRLLHIDTPETSNRRYKITPLEKKAGKLVQKFLQRILKSNVKNGIWINSFEYEKDAFKRILGEIIIDNELPTTNINSTLLNMQVALPYDEVKNRRKKIKSKVSHWTEDELNIVIEKLRYLL